MFLPPCLHSLPHCLSWKEQQLIVCGQDQRCLKKMFFHTGLWCFLSPSPAHLVALCSFREKASVPHPSKNHRIYIYIFLYIYIYIFYLLSNGFAFSLCCVPHPVIKLVNSFPAHTCNQIQVLGSNVPGSPRMYTHYSIFSQPVALCNCK